MAQEHVGGSELPNIVTVVADKLGSHLLQKYLYLWENVIFSMIIVCALTIIAFMASRKKQLIPGRLQNLCEVLVGVIDDFVCGILGEKGRKYTPFIGTIFFYVLFMNLSGLVPFFKSSTSSWSTTFAIAICVFFYVQYSAFKELGFIGYLDHLAGKPRGGLAYSIVIPLMLFVLHLISELIKPLSLSLRLRSNIWGEDLLLKVLAGFGMPAFPLFFVNMMMAVLASVVQAVVFTLLSLMYFALVLIHDEHEAVEEKEVISISDN